jgi:deazaflavin-dependent oxidoreductase (nitroreductase family)
MSREEPPPSTNGPRYGPFTRALQRLGHVRPFTIATRYAGSKLDRVLYRTTGGRITLTGPNLPTMLLTTRGRKTGKPRTVPVFYVRDGRNVVAACENFGLTTPAGWPANLRADPSVTIQIGSTVASYRARPATDEETARAMPRLLSVWPAHDTYLRRTGVRYVFVFEPVPDLEGQPETGAVGLVCPDRTAASPTSLVVRKCAENYQLTYPRQRAMEWADSTPARIVLAPWADARVTDCGVVARGRAPG